MRRKSVAGEQMLWKQANYDKQRGGGNAAGNGSTGHGSTDGTSGANQTAMIGKPMMLMNKEEKIRALDYLDQKGVFKITKTSLLLCDAMQISKYTLYNYLEEARISRKSETNE